MMSWFSAKSKSILYNKIPKEKGDLSAIPIFEATLRIIPNLNSSE